MIFNAHEAETAPGTANGDAGGSAAGIAVSMAVMCDKHGIIVDVLSDPLGMSALLQVGMPFPRLAVRGSLAKALSFIAEIHTKGAAFDWELAINCRDQVRSLHFTGGKVQDKLLIIGAHDGSVALKLYEEMMRMNNEQTNALRMALKENHRDAELYDEISRLNNELVSMQRELAKKNAELEHLNQEKNRFLGMAAHDLRNPLQVVLSASQMLWTEHYPMESADKLELLQAIRSASKFMARLIDDLLDVAIIESGQLQLNYEVVDLGALLTKNTTLNRVFAAEKQTEISLTLDALPPVVIDPAKMGQVLNNLIGNAIKFSPPGSQIEVRLENQGDHFCISIKDQGPGIAEEEQARLFKPFQRGRAIGTSGEESTGLGLMIVKRSVEGQGGTIWLESRLGAGSTFFVRLPCEPPEDDGAH